jgi:hypothetical protein
MSLAAAALQQDILDSFGFAIKQQWLEQLLQQLQAAHDGSFGQLPRGQQRQELLEQLLMADFRAAGAGGHLPAAVQVREQNKDCKSAGLMMQHYLHVSEPKNPPSLACVTVCLSVFRLEVNSQLWPGSGSLAGILQASAYQCLSQLAIISM